MENNNNAEISSLAERPNIDTQTIIQQLLQGVESDARVVETLAQKGLITSFQRQNLLTQLEKKVRAIQSYVQNESLAPVQNNPVSDENQKDPFELFNQEKPGFFDMGGRNSVFEYLRNLDLDKDEIVKIAGLIEDLEKSAVDGYLKQSALDKSINDENLKAKSKLTSYAQGASNGSDFAKIFTREDIGKMTGDEFAKNEKIIMDQVKQGLIK